MERKRVGNIGNKKHWGYWKQCKEKGLEILETKGVGNTEEI
jgi:hypothetical protein